MRHETQQNRNVEFHFVQPNLVAQTMIEAGMGQESGTLVREALKEWNPKVDVRFARDGRELMDYLHTCEADMKGSEKPCPDLILLDLNMPVKNGREALREIRADTRLKSIPVVILSTSSDQDDIDFCHRLGASSFISKSIDFQDLVSKMKALGSYWFGAVSLPGVRFPADSE